MSRLYTDLMIVGEIYDNLKKGHKLYTNETKEFFYSYDFKSGLICYYENDEDEVNLLAINAEIMLGSESFFEIDGLNVEETNEYKIHKHFKEWLDLAKKKDENDD